MELVENVYIFLCSFFLASLIAFIVTLIHKSKYTFWSKQGIKGPTPIPYFGNTTDLLSGSLLSRLDSNWRKYGSVHGLYRGQNPELVVGDPSMVKDILVHDWNVFADRKGHSKDGNPITDNFLFHVSGNDWKRMRSVITPTFSSGKMKSMYGIMDNCCKLLLQNIQKTILEKNYEKEKILEINLRHLTGCYSMDVIAKCCFATDTNSFKDPNNVFVSAAKIFFGVSKFRRFFALILPSWIKKAIGFTMSGKAGIEFFANVSRTLLNERIKNGHESNDYLQLLIEASKGTIDTSRGKKSSKTVPDHESYHGYDEANVNVAISLPKESKTAELQKQSLISEDEIVSNSVLFLVVGYDTTSNLIAMACYNLACYQESQEHLYNEIKSAHKQNGGKFDHETFSELKYLDCVISETLRLFPPAPVIERRSTMDYTFKDNGIFLPKGAIVTLPIWNVHRDAKHWPEPEKFDPSRFLPENRSKIVPYSYIPFGGGPRNCVGMRFALLEAKLAIAHLVLNFKFTPTANTDIPLDLSPTLGLLSAKRVFLGLKNRK